MTAVTHQTIDTLYSADSIEWCPIPGFEDIMLCGTYQLEESKDDAKTDGSPQVRVGRLYMYKLENQSTSTPKLKLCTSLDMPGILDIKWSYQTINGRPYFGVVNSVGQIKVFVVKNEDMVVMVTEEQLDVVNDDGLGLSLEWNNMLNTSDETSVISSDSKGGIHVHKFCEGCLKEITSWKAHDFEAWIAAYNQWDINTVYTGGDDCRLKGWDLRMDPKSPVFTSKRHTMGVCSIQSNPVKEYQLATGSYDENMLLWDSRKMKHPITELNLGGGIWRIKWEPKTADYILTATMYNGFHIVDISNNDDLKICCHFKEHESIAYGADWCRSSQSKVQSSADVSELDCESKTTEYIIGTCSFYDHLCKLWSIDLNKNG
ncbi:Diphthine methyltransferase [Mactra antiquata]